MEPQVIDSPVAPGMGSNVIYQVTLASGAIATRPTDFPDDGPQPRQPGAPERIDEPSDRARAMPGVAELLEVYGKLSAYTGVMVNVQPSQARNATGGNAPLTWLQDPAAAPP